MVRGMSENISPKNSKNSDFKVDLFGMVMQLVGIVCVIIALVVVIKLRQGFELVELINQPSLMWSDAFSSEAAVPK